MFFFLCFSTHPYPEAKMCILFMKGRHRDILPCAWSERQAEICWITEGGTEKQLVGPE